MLTTNISKSDERTITIRGRNLVDELIGKRSYTEMMYFLMKDRFPTTNETRVLDACLVTLMEHGLTPSAIVTRLVLDNVPAEAQVAMAAGLMTVGSVFVGTIEGCAKILNRGIDSIDRSTFCRDVIAEHVAQHRPLPGFGHRLHKPDDPRAIRLITVAKECGVPGHHVALLQQLGAELDRVSQRHLTINATGAIAALLLEIGLPVEAMRALAVVSRAGGLPGHVLEEKRTHSGRRIWRMVDEGIPYEDPNPA